MTPPAADSSQPAEKPTAYRGAGTLIGGGLVMLFCAFGAIDLLVEAGTRDLVGSAILATVAVLAGLYGVYPATFSFTDRLVVRNPFRTIELPWDAVTDLSARLSFMAHTETRRFTVWSIPVSLRERRRAERGRLRDLSQAQRAAKRGASADAFQSSRPRRPVDPIEKMSFADQAIEEMNARREAYTVQARIKARAAAKAAGAAESAPTDGSVAEGQTADVTGTSAMPVTGETATVPVDSGAVRWAWSSFAVLAACLAYLIVAFVVH